MSLYLLALEYLNTPTTLAKSLNLLVPTTTSDVSNIDIMNVLGVKELNIAEKHNKRIFTWNGPDKGYFDIVKRAFPGLSACYVIGISTVTESNNTFHHKLVLQNDAKSSECSKVAKRMDAADSKESKEYDLYIDEKEVEGDAFDDDVVKRATYLTRTHRRRPWAGAVPNQPDRDPASDLLRRLSRVSGRCPSVKNGMLVFTVKSKEKLNFLVARIRELHLKPAINYARLEQYPTSHPIEMPLPYHYKLGPVQAYTTVSMHTDQPDCIHTAKVKILDFLNTVGIAMPIIPEDIVRKESDACELSGALLDLANKYLFTWNRYKKISQGQKLIPYVDAKTFELGEIKILGDSITKGNCIVIVELLRRGGSSLTDLCANRGGYTNIPFPAPKVCYSITQKDLEDCLAAFEKEREKHNRINEDRFCLPEETDSVEITESEDRPPEWFSKLVHGVEYRVCTEEEAEFALGWYNEYLSSSLIRFDPQRKRWMASIRKYDGTFVHLPLTKKRYNQTFCFYQLDGSFTTTDPLKEFVESKRSESVANSAQPKVALPTETQSTISPQSTSQAQSVAATPPVATQTQSSAAAASQGAHQAQSAASPQDAVSQPAPIQVQPSEAVIPPTTEPTHSRSLKAILSRVVINFFE